MKDNPCTLKPGWLMNRGARFDLYTFTICGKKKLIKSNYLGLAKSKAYQYAMNHVENGESVFKFKPSWESLKPYSKDQAKQIHGHQTRC